MSGVVLPIFPAIFQVLLEGHVVGRKGLAGELEVLDAVEAEGAKILPLAGKRR